MARTPSKKATQSKDSSPLIDDTPLISEQQAWDVLKMAGAIYNGMYPNIFTPEMVNSRMKDVTMNPLVATMDGINKALASPKSSEDALIGYSEYLELNSMLYKRVLLYFSGLMSFDWTYVCTNMEDEKEESEEKSEPKFAKKKEKTGYKSKQYLKDLKVVEKFFDSFNIKKEFKTVMREILRNETYFGVLRDEGKKFILQELPRQYCKITGRWDFGLLFDFNMNWFLQPGVSLDMYPSFFTKAYRKVFLKGGTLEYNPALPINMRNDTWVYWAQTRPDNGFVAFKFFEEIATNVPFLAPFMPDAVMQPMIRSLQLDANIASASKMISGQVPFLKDAKASVKDAIALDPTTLGKFLALVQSALPKAIKILSAPLDNIQAVEFSSDNQLYDSYLSTAASSSGINSRLIYSKDRQNLLETTLSLDIDQNILRPVYEMFAGILEYWVNSRTSKYKFKFILEGFETSPNREERMNTVFKYAESGIVLEQKFASAIGISPFDFRRMLAEAKSNKFVDGLTPIIKASQTPAGGGRPAKPTSKLGESGAETREAGSDKEKGVG